MVTVNELSKSYGTVQALRGISLTIAPGELFGLIGPDGAGKSTLFRVLTTLLLPDKGSASVAGHDVVKDFKEIRRCVGYMPGRFSLYQDLTVEENLTFFATVFRTSIKENYELIQAIYTQIEPFKKRRAGALSGGMKQKLALCCALIHRPTVLFLDEPTTGVDPVSRQEFWEMLDRLKQQGITILVSTPYMDEASRCDRIAFLSEGKILDVATPQGMIEKFDRALWRVSSDHTVTLLTDLRLHPEVESAFAFGDTHHITLKKEHAITPQALEAYLTNLGHEAIRVQPQQATIEDCFMKLAK